MSEYSSQCLKILFMLVVTFFLVACAKQSVDSNASLALTQAAIVEPEYQKAALVNVELGLNYLAQDQMARAKHKLMYALKLAPNAVEPHSALAFFFEKAGDVIEAEREHKKALHLGLAKGALANNYAAFLYRQNRFQEASEFFRQALQDKRYEYSAEVNENAGFCALKQRNEQQAENYFNQAIRQDPKRSQALLALAALKVQQQNWVVAKSLLLRYQDLAGVSAKALLLNIEVAVAENDHGRRANHAATLKALFSDSEEYQQFLQSQRKGKQV